MPNDPHPDLRPDDSQAIELLRQLVAIPSVSGDEAAASTWLTSWMKEQGFDRAFVDEAGNAIGELGAHDASDTIVLLGHIDTVPGDIPVRIETIPTEDRPDGEPVLYGRGSVDAKGPLAAFVAACARLGSSFAHERNLRLVVAGAVEEEAATSRGARFLEQRFDGRRESVPRACIIGEPSRWHRITLGYKGRLLIDFEASREMTHTAGPDPGVAVVAIDFWRHIADSASVFNRDRPRPFDQFQPSVRSLGSDSEDGFRERVRATVGLRLPLDFDSESLERNLRDWCRERAMAEARACEDDPSSTLFEGETLSIRLSTRGHERAWKSERSTPLVRAFLGAIRHQDQEQSPGFVVKTGTSDMNVVGPAWRCPILAYGPGDSALDHTPNEHQALSEYLRAIDVLEQALTNLGDQRPAERTSTAQGI